jgi:hypothetical protein
MTEKKSISVQLEIDVVDMIDQLRKPKRLPRTIWLYHAIMDKIEKDNKERNDLD